jgi:hypothetical protein
MRAFLVCILIFFCASSYIHAQQALRADHVVDRNTGAIIVKEFQPKPETVESIYLYDDWSTGKVVLPSGIEFTQFPMKFDLKNNLIELQVGSSIKILPVDHCKSFEMNRVPFTQVFQNASTTALQTISGAVEELAKGKVLLYSQPYVEIIKANYNVAMDVGNRNDRYLKKEKLLLVSNGEIHDITKAGRKILTYLHDHADSIEKFVEEKQLSYKNKDDVVAIIQFYNSL